MCDASSRVEKSQPSNSPTVAEYKARNETPLSNRSINTTTKPSNRPKPTPGRLLCRAHRGIGFFDDAVEFFRGCRECIGGLAQMRNARFQVFHVRRRERFLVQTRECSIDVLHGGAHVVEQRAAFAREIVNARF